MPNSRFRGITIKNLNKLMKEKGLTPFKLGKKAGVNHAMIYKLLQGKQKDLMLSTAFKLADALEVDINDFREE